MFRRPLALFALAFALGLLMARALPASALCIEGGLLLLCTAFALVSKKENGKMGAALCFAALLGTLRMLQANAPGPNDISRYAPHLVTLTVIARSDAQVPVHSIQPGEQSARLSAEALLVGNSPASGGLSLALRLPSGPVRLPQEGDLVEARGVLAAIAPLRDPGLAACTASPQPQKYLLSVRAPEAWHILPPQFSQNPVGALAFALHRRTLALLQQALPVDRSALAAALLLGDRNSLTPAQTDDFERAGALFLFAASGLQVGLLTLLLLRAMRWMRLPRRLYFLFTPLLLMAYSLITGGHPAAFRAALMASLYLLAPLLQREPDFIAALSASLLLFLFLTPAALFTPGLLFTLLIAITIFRLRPLFAGAVQKASALPQGAPRSRRRLYRLRGRACEALFFALAAQLGAAPLSAFFFHSLSPAGPAASLLLVPLAALLLLCAFPAALVGLVLPSAGTLLFRILSFPIGLLQAAAHWFAAPVPALLSVLSPPLWLLAACYAMLWTAPSLWLKKEPPPLPLLEEEEETA